MLRETTNKIFYVLIVFLATQIMVRFLYSYVGDDIGMLGLFPSFLFGWFWGPLFGFIGAVLTVIVTSINFFTMGSTLTDAFANVFGMAVTIVLSIGFGFFSKILKKNNRLTKELERKSNTLSKILEEKNSAEESLIQKIELIRFTNQISADFINVPAVFLESRIDNALKQIIDFIDARSCCIYINKEGKDYTLFKEYFNNKSISTIPYLYKIEYEKLSDFIDTFLTHPILVIEKKVWNHEIFDLFQTDNAVLLPMLGSNKLTGFIFFEKGNADNDWQLHYNDIFQLVKQVIFTALERLFAEEKIVSQYEELKRYSESLFKTNVKLNNLNETLISTSNALMESESRFRELSENIEDIIWLQEGRKILYVNNAYNKILGLKRENLYKNTLDFIKRIHPEDREELLKSYSNHNYDIHGIFRAEFRYFGINGEIKYMEARSFLISRDNKKSKIAGIAEDITLKKKAEKEIKSALFKALELNQLKTKFITTVSHQLRTPLANILSSIELLQNYGEGMNGKEKSTHYERIITSVDYLTTILDNVIVVDQSESGIVSASYQKINLISLVKDRINDCIINFRSNANIILIEEIDFLEIVTDPKLLIQIIDNLISNAIKFSLPQSPVEIKIEKRLNTFLIKVTDYGIGIPENEQSEIFMPFYRAVNAQNIQGTGLGLAIVRRWTNILGGSLSFFSILDKGSTFTLELPIDSEKNGRSESGDYIQVSKYN